MDEWGCLSGFGILQWICDCEPSNIQSHLFASLESLGAIGSSSLAREAKPPNTHLKSEPPPLSLDFMIHDIHDPWMKREHSYSAYSVHEVINRWTKIVGILRSKLRYSKSKMAKSPRVDEGENGSNFHVLLVFIFMKNTLF